MVDVIIIGAGAAGLMCAREAGKRGRSVLLLERNSSIGEKIRISGGGRCNFTNVNTTADNYLSSNPHFCISALARTTPKDFIALLEQHTIFYHEKTLGQLFCDGSAQQIIDMLRRECSECGVQVTTDCGVVGVERDEHYRVITNHGEFLSNTLVVATGGLSIPSLGATDFGYRIAEKFRLTTLPTKPGLVPLVLDGEELELCHALTGAAIDVKVSCGRTVFRGNLLFTHRGVSGPATLQISSYWNPGDEIAIDVLPDIDIGEEFEKHRQSRTEVKTVLQDFLPKRFVDEWCGRNSLCRMIQRIPKVELYAISQRLHCWTLHPVGTEGYSKAEVTVGGIDTSELSSKTMEAKKVPGLFFIGEVVDVTGHLGGYNFQWAWASGAAAGRAL